MLSLFVLSFTFANALHLAFSSGFVKESKKILDRNF